MLALLTSTTLGACRLSRDARCTKDTDCKGDRVCENGQCVSPPGVITTTASATAAPSASVATTPTSTLAIGSDLSIETVACSRDGQLGAQEVKVAPTMKVRITKALAALAAPEKRLRVYSDGVVTALGPPGWTCSGYDGSGGSGLNIGPHAAELAPGTGGEAIRVRNHFWQTSGRLTAAKVAARLFPSLRAKSQQIYRDMAMPPPATAPWPGEHVTVDGNIARYEDPANIAGTGHETTELAVSALPTIGSVLDAGDMLSVIAIRLAVPRNELAEAIRADFEAGRSDR